MFWTIFDTITHSLVYYCLICYIIWVLACSFILIYDSMRFGRFPPLDFLAQGIIPFVMAPVIIPWFFGQYIIYCLRKR